jgi:hypothetical protein
VEGFARGKPRPDHFGALGFLAGKIAGNRIPFFRGIRPGPDDLKAMGAAMAATGAVALFHAEGITPEAGQWLSRAGRLEEHTITSGEVRDLLKGMEVEAVAMGCPHCSGGELAEIARLLRGKRVRKPLFVFTSRHIMDENRSIVDGIEASGARVYADTCMVVSPMMESFSSIMVDSGKAYAYVPSMCGALARIGTREECVAEATGRTGG